MFHSSFCFKLKLQQQAVLQIQHSYVAPTIPEIIEIVLIIKHSYLAPIITEIIEIVLKIQHSYLAPIIPEIIEDNTYHST